MNHAVVEARFHPSSTDQTFHAQFFALVHMYTITISLSNIHFQIYTVHNLTHYTKILNHNLEYVHCAQFRTVM